MEKNPILGLVNRLIIEVGPNSSWSILYLIKKICFFFKKMRAGRIYTNHQPQDTFLAHNVLYMYLRHVSSVEHRIQLVLYDSES